MALPKRRHSRSRKGKRRAHWKMAPPTLSLCPHCKQPKRPHRVCPKCGYYGEEEVVVVKAG